MFTTLQRKLRFGRLVLTIGTCAVLVGTFCSLSSSTAQEVVGDLSHNSASSSSAAEPSLLREGSRITNRPAVCRISGERLILSFDGADSSKAMIALENLAAQRIVQSVADDVADANWIVGGQITEFQDRNYILLDRVIRQTKSNH